MNLFKSKTSLEVQKFKELEEKLGLTDRVEESVEPKAVEKPSEKFLDNKFIDVLKSLENQFALYNRINDIKLRKEADFLSKRVPTSHSVITTKEGKTEILFQCNDGTMWVYEYGSKPKWKQLPNVPQD